MAVRGSFEVLVAACALFSAFPAGAAENYPARPVRIVVPVPAGGGVDSVARIVAQHLNAVWGVPFIVDNRPGAGTALGAEIVANASPDGYTLMVSSSSFITNAAVRKVRYDPVRDFAPITKLTSNPYILLVTPTLPVDSVKDLIALAKSKPGKLNYGSSGIGGILHLGAALFTMMTGTKMVHVPYKGVAGGYPAVASGQVDWMLGSPISAEPLIKAGKLKPIAVTSAKRSKALPKLPAIAETVPGYEVNAWYGFFAPAKVPERLVERLYQEAAMAVKDPELTRRLEAGGTETVGNPPAEFARQVKAEFKQWHDLARKAHLKVQ